MFCSISFELLDTYICALVWFIFLLHFIRHTFYISGKQKKEILHHCHHFLLSPFHCNLDIHTIITYHV